MIKIEIFRNKNNEIYGFRADNHGASIVCSAVSVLTFNCVNCIEAFTEADFSFEAAEKGGGFLKIEVGEIKNNAHNHDADLIFNCLLLGLSGVEAQYPEEVKIIDREV